jgi:hypothetical protein
MPRGSKSTGGGLSGQRNQKTSIGPVKLGAQRPSMGGPSGQRGQQTAAGVAAGRTDASAPRPADMSVVNKQRV